MIQWLRSFFFVVIIYLGMIPIGLWFAPAALRSRDGALAGCKAWCAFVRWLAPWMVGLTFEVRGTPPTEESLVAGKHQSFLDIILIFHSLPRGKFIMKKSLMKAPILGWYAKRLNCIPVDRGKRAEAVRKMLEDVASGHADPGQLIIYPQGTRIAPGVKAPYKIGTYILYKESGQPCYPVAANVGLFWPKKGIIRRPGKAIIEFLPPIAPGLDEAAFMARLENDIETASNRLMREAGFKEIEE
ncbi:MAG: lysophospholipid acyltransferase family protein [Pseudomonadota bacterium]